MKKEDYASLQKLSMDELVKRLAVARREKASLTMSSRVGQEKNSSLVRIARRNVARIQTAISEKELLAV